MSKSSFLYVTYIRTTPQRLWEALTGPEFNKQYWFGMHQESDWEAGKSWKLVFADGRIADTGEVLAVEPPTRLVLKWRNEFRPEVKADGDTICTFVIEPDGEMTKLTVTHEADGDKPQHMLIDAVSQGWPKVLSSLKSFIETGRALPGTDHLPR